MPQNQNQVYCQVRLNIQGICFGIWWCEHKQSKEISCKVYMLEPVFRFYKKGHLIVTSVVNTLWPNPKPRPTPYPYTLPLRLRVRAEGPPH